MKVDKYLFGEMTWPEVKQVVKEERVAVVPVAMIEEHGHHLPVDTDVVLANEVCVRAAKQIPEDMVVIPPINHGYAPHQMDFPGVISISQETFIHYVVDVCNSLAHQGFKRILLLNGHGSNVPLLKVAARQVFLEYPDVMCASMSHWDFEPVVTLANEIRDSENPGGINHAGELETSMYLAIKEDLVQMDKAVRDLDKYQMSKYFWLDLVGTGEGRPVVMVPQWSAISETGTLGDPRPSTKEKGEKLLGAAVDGLVEFIKLYKERDHGPRVNHHL
ncbi:creatininase family protein [Thalassobacillus hwangdonensis]|uniref:Creatininase family protein n=1 Tax=Thalassobacillus hwangdonensis TaxID=546108 RepID=A0ABW3L1K3_9BACI